MCFYHSVAIKIEIDLSEVLALNQIANDFPEEDESMTPLRGCIWLHVQKGKQGPWVLN